jgi:hypothetical protein
MLSDQEADTAGCVTGRVKNPETNISKGYFFAVIQEKVRSQRQTIRVQTMGTNGNP